jgi:hypothetical protein
MMYEVVVYSTRTDEIIVKVKADSEEGAKNKAIKKAVDIDSDEWDEGDETFEAEIIQGKSQEGHEADDPDDAVEERPGTTRQFDEDNV